MKKVLLLLVLFAGIYIQAGTVPQDTETLTGVVRITTDETGLNVIRVDLVVLVEVADENGEISSNVIEYRIEDNDLATELHELDGVLVEITGKISGDEKSGLMIEAKSYSVFEESEENIFDDP